MFFSCRRLGDVAVGDSDPIAFDCRIFAYPIASKLANFAPENPPREKREYFVCSRKRLVVSGVCENRLRVCNPSRGKGGQKGPFCNGIWCVSLAETGHIALQKGRFDSGKGYIFAAVAAKIAPTAAEKGRGWLPSRSRLEFCFVTDFYRLDNICALIQST